jgi:hypothetical protein
MKPFQRDRTVGHTDSDISCAMMKHLRRCPWARTPLDIKHHDEEWGVPCHDDRVLFEMLISEGPQAGLSWLTILAKRENYSRAFASFDPREIARFTTKDVRRLLVQFLGPRPDTQVGGEAEEPAANDDASF